jgi:hypothetical protein
MASVARSVRRRRQLEDWKAIPWRCVQRSVFRLQQRIYQAERRGDYEQVHNLQRLLLRSWSARCLAVRRVSQDNRGKRTPGVDGVANLTLKQRLALIEELRNVSSWQADAIRRTYIDKRGTTEKRGLGIPMLHSHCTSYNRLLDFALGRLASPAYPVYHQSVILTSAVTSVVARACATQR